MERTISEALGAARARPSWETYFLKIAVQVAERSTCLRRQTGAILVKDRRILATGYNGAPSGLAHCGEVGCLRERQGVASGQRHELCRGLHAEQNAIIQCAQHGVPTLGSTLYSTHQPCALCAKMSVNAGVKDIYYGLSYPDRLAEKILEEAGVRLVEVSQETTSGAVAHVTGQDAGLAD